MAQTATLTHSSASGNNPIQLYSLSTPNGQKIGIALEEFGLEYDAHTVDIKNGVQFEDWFKKINPNSKIPAIVDLNPPNGNGPVTVFESGAILIYLADRTGQFLAPIGSQQRYETLEWLMWQMSGIGPMFGQTNHFYKAAKEQIEYAKDRYMTEAKRLLNVLDIQLAKTNAFVSGVDYTIADMAIYPWVVYFINSYNDHLGETNYKHVRQWLTTIGERPQVKKGLQVCSLD